MAYTNAFITKRLKNLEEAGSSSLVPHTALASGIISYMQNLRANSSLQYSVDKAMSAVAVLHPLMAAPQIYDIYSRHSATDVSLATWLLFWLMGLVFLAYAIIHKIKPIIVTQILWFAVDIVMVVGILLYR